ncbi:MAG: nuclear transport factor 2 family protein [Acidobacteriota bacterium]|jgi:hypothetical protein|nr:nuclear transport factor 2 family protein [Bryobacteraceae bacterium CoA2 C42]
MRVLFLLLLALPLVAADKREVEIDAAMNQLADALRKPEVASLEKILGEQLIYTHSNGRIENKKEVIEALAVKKSTIYAAVDYAAEKQLAFHGNTAVVRRDTTVKLLGADPRTMKLSILYVWVKGKGGWQLVGRQATRL